MKRYAQFALIGSFASFALSLASYSQEAPPDMVKLEYKMPKPRMGSWILNLKSPNLEPPRGDKPRPPIYVPLGCSNLALKKRVTSSNPRPATGSLDLVTDGDKDDDDGGGTYVDLGPGLQWVQIDLGKTCEIWAIVVWHRHYKPRIYHNVVIQVAGDADFIGKIETVFNNNCGNSYGLGIGRDYEYIETYDGRPIAVKGVKGRYIRLHSNGNSANEMNHYIEVEVYGK